MMGRPGWTTVLVGLVALSACASASTPADPGPAGPAEGSRLLATEEAQARRMEAQGSASPIAPVAPATAPVCSEFLRPGVLRRAAVVRVVDRGLGQWLSQVRVVHVHKGRKFTGWQISQLYPEDPCYRAVDLQVGDIVTRVNGASLEKPDQANQIFQGLRTAPGLEVELLRQGVQRRVSLTIAD
jgi:hypothetical protein